MLPLVNPTGAVKENSTRGGQKFLRGGEGD